jgi:hypothetical protein
MHVRIVTWRNAAREAEANKKQQHIPRQMQKLSYLKYRPAHPIYAMVYEDGCGYIRVSIGCVFMRVIIESKIYYIYKMLL